MVLSILRARAATLVKLVGEETLEISIDFGEWSILKTRAKTLVKLVGEETLEISIDFGEWVYLRIVDVKSTICEAREWIHTL